MFVEKAMVPHSSTLAWKTPWTEEPGGLLSMGSHRVRHDWSDLAAAAVTYLNLSGVQSRTPWGGRGRPDAHPWGLRERLDVYPRGLLEQLDTHRRGLVGNDWTPTHGASRDNRTPTCGASRMAPSGTAGHHLTCTPRPPGAHLRPPTCLMSM